MKHLTVMFSLFVSLGLFSNHPPVRLIREAVRYFQMRPEATVWHTSRLVAWTEKRTDKNLWMIFQTFEAPKGEQTLIRVHLDHDQIRSMWWLEPNSGWDTGLTN